MSALDIADGLRHHRPSAMVATPAASPPAASRPFRLLGQLLAARRVAAILLFTPAACVVQSVLLLLPGPGKVRFAAFYWAAIASLLGLRVRVVGVPARRAERPIVPGRAERPIVSGHAERPSVPGHAERPIVYVCNHASWLDIPAVGGVLHACFVSKDDVAGWPIVGTIARLGRSIFVSRSRQDIGRERDTLRERLAAGDDLILFPEGTSSDGSRVLPFHSSFFAAAYRPAGDAAPVPLIQPVSVVYDRLAGLPLGRCSRTVFAWYGDMDLAPHLWRFAQWRGKRVSLLFHPTLDPQDFASRKALSQAAWQVVADGAAALRQNRPQ